MTDTATVTIAVTGLNDPPVAQNDSVSTDEDTVLVGDVFADNGNGIDDDPDTSDVIMVTAVVGFGGGTVGVPIVLPSGAIVQVNANGVLNYNPNGQFESLAVGETDSDHFYYEISDGTLTDQATVYVTIHGRNDPPTADDDSITAGEDDGATNVTATLLAGDTDPDTSDIPNLAVGGVDTTGTTGTVVFSNGAVSYDPAGQFEALATGETDSDSFGYTLTDGSLTDTGTANVTINGANDPPIASDNAVTTPEDSVLTGNVITDNDGFGPDTDTDTSDIPGLTVTGVSGSVGVVGVQFTLTSGALLTVNADGTYTYDPNGVFGSLAAGATGIDNFAYVLSDTGGLTDTAAVSVTITGSNDAPIALDDVYSTTEDTQLVVPTDGVLGPSGGGDDSDPDGDGISVSEVNGNPADVGMQIVLASGARLTLNADGSLTYDPTGAFDDLALGETRDDNFTYAISDGGGLTATATVTITVHGEKDAPVAVDDRVTTDEDSVLNGADVLVDNDFGPDTDAEGQTLTVTQVDGDAGNVDSVITTGGGGLLLVNSDGTFSYDPNGQFENLDTGETDQDTFTYTITDGMLSSSATVTIVITGVNDPPVARDDLVSTDEDSVLTTKNVLNDNGNGADSDVDGDNLTVAAVNGNPASVGNTIVLASGALLRVNGDGTFSYDPNGQFDDLAVGESRQDFFNYDVSDGSVTDNAQVTITVTGVNDPPVADDDSITANEDSSRDVTSDLLNGDSDPENDPLTITAVDDASTTGTVSVNAGVVTYDPNGQFEALAVGQTGTDTFGYTLSDGVLTDTALVSVTVNGENDRPVARDDTGSTDEDTELTGNNVISDPPGQDTDVDTGDVLTVTEVSGSVGTVGTQFALTSGALLLIQANGDYSYDPNGQFEGLGSAESATDTFSYTVSDGDLSALQSSVLFRGGRPRPLVAVVPTRTRSNCVTARWGGKQRMRTRSTAMTSEHDSASIAATSLLGTGEVCWTKVRQSLRKYTDARKMPIGVVDGSRSGKEDAGECRRSVRVRPPERTPDRSQSRHRS